jgi:hypothetical protein
MAYPVIWQAYNHDMNQAAAFARRLFPDKNIAAGEFPADVLHTFGHLKSIGVINWGSLLSMVTTKAECLEFVTTHNLDFEEFINVLNYLLRWAFPFQTASRELLAHEELSIAGGIYRVILLNKVQGFVLNSIPVSTELGLY